jgi:choline dehydrogenase-like flavoprotein
VHVDARELADGAVVEADVCVAGAGPAGLVVATELDVAGSDVVLVERGSEPSPGEVAGVYPALESTRAGGVGGTAALWDAELAPGRYGARFAPLSAIDFEEREGWPESGWPLRRSELDRWYTRAHELCRAGPYAYDGEAAHIHGLSRTGSLATGVLRFGLGEVFTERHRDAVRRSSRVTVMEPATAIDLRAERGAVTELRAATAPGRTFAVRARTYVLALGGIENARLLLLAGLGNEHDLVGRFFMDHPTARCRLDAAPGSAHRLRAYDVRQVDGGAVVQTIVLPEETLERQQLLNGGFFIVPALDREVRAVQSARTLAAAARRRRLPAGVRSDVRNVVVGIDAIAVAAHRRLARSAPLLRPTTRLSRRFGLLDTLGVGAVSGWSGLRKEPRTFDVYHVVEQAPERERRVTLGGGRDRFGSPVAHLRFFVSERELTSLERTEELVGGELARAGLGRVRTARELAPDGDLTAALHPSAHHHLGTTRMHGDPRRGVVDADGRVHGVRNLFVIGGSVFPTSGYVNPTLTIVALAARLAAHLR